MKQLISATAAVAVFLIGPHLAAQSAVFENDTLTVPGVGVVDGDNANFYTDVELSYEGDNLFRLVAADDSTLVAVDSVTVALMESFPVQVSISVAGNKSVPCVELLPAAVSRVDFRFKVVLAETVLGPAESCIAMVDPFETTIALDVLNLPAGTYTVDVNGVVAEFTLDVDNTAQQ